MMEGVDSSGYCDSWGLHSPAAGILSFHQAPARKASCLGILGQGAVTRYRKTHAAREHYSGDGARTGDGPASVARGYRLHNSRGTASVESVLLAQLVVI